MGAQASPTNYTAQGMGTMSGLGNFNPGGLGGYAQNSPYWQPQAPQMMQQQGLVPAMQGSAMSAQRSPMAQQSGFLLPSQWAPYAQTPTFGKNLERSRYNMNGMMTQIPQSANMIPIVPSQRAMAQMQRFM